MVTERDYDFLWILLGRAVTVLMLPWMIWVSLSIVTLQRDVAVISKQTETLPPQWFQDKVTNLETRVERLEHP